MKPRDQKGFLLIEVLVAILVLSISMVAIVGTIGQVLTLSKRADETAKAVFQMENLLFSLESGARSDLVLYGGRENLSDGFGCEIKTVRETEPFYSLKARLFQKDNVPFLNLEAFLAERLLQ